MTMGGGTQHLHNVLFESGALRWLAPEMAEQVDRIYRDPLRNRTFAFFDAVLGPQRALQAIGKLEAIKVGIVGCGGIGSAIAYLLAGMGVRRFVFIDPDLVEKSNLTRQVLFQLSDIGKPKVNSLGLALQNRFDNVEIEKACSNGLNRKALGLLSTADLIICAGDEPPDLAHRLRELVPSNIGIWACGYALGVSVVRPPSTVGKRSSRAPLWQSLPNGFAPSIGFQNFEIAAHCCAQLAFELAAKSNKSRTVYVRDYREMC